jgi:hypothetical protein
MAAWRFSWKCLIISGTENMKLQTSWNRNVLLKISTFRLHETGMSFIISSPEDTNKKRFEFYMQDKEALCIVSKNVSSERKIFSVKTAGNTTELLVAIQDFNSISWNFRYKIVIGEFYFLFYQFHCRDWLILLKLSVVLFSSYEMLGYYLKAEPASNFYIISNSLFSRLNFIRCYRYIISAVEHFDEYI